MMRNAAFFLLIIFCFSCNSVERKDRKSEIQIISEKISKNPQDIDLLYSRVNYNKSQDNLESALYDLKDILTLDSLDAMNHSNIAEVYFELSKKSNSNPKYPQLAKYHLVKSIEIDDNIKRPHSLMGELLLAYYKYEEAIQSFNKSLEIDYNQERTHMLMGYAFKQLGKNDNAINCYRNAVNINPDFFDAYVELGMIFHLLGDTLAVTYYDNALRIKPSDEMTLYNKALFFQSQLDWNNALEAYAVLHQVSPFHSSGHYNLGFIHMELGHYDIAVNNFADAIYSNSEFFNAYYARGNCFEALGNIAQAEADYLRAIEINPQYDYAVEALESLRNKNKQYN